MTLHILERNKMIILYGMVVKVIAGFYIGCSGVVLSEDMYSGKYYVSMECPSANLPKDEIKEWLYSGQLEVVEKVITIDPFQFNMEKK